MHSRRDSLLGLPNFPVAHSRAVARLAYSLAKAIPLSEEQARSIRIGAYLHDLGKVAIPPEILDKPGPPGSARVARCLRASCRRDEIVPVPYAPLRVWLPHPLPPRALGRHRLPQWVKRQANPYCRPDHRDRRRVPRNDQRPPLPEGHDHTGGTATDTRVRGQAMERGGGCRPCARSAGRPTLGKGSTWSISWDRSRPRQLSQRQGVRLSRPVAWSRESSHDTHFFSRKVLGQANRYSGCIGPIHLNGFLKVS